MMRATIVATVDAYLCTSCGACVGVCPTEAITMNETPGGMLRPSIDGERCTRCGKCYAVCPGWQVRLHDMQAGSDPFVGPILAAYEARAADRKTLLNGQSGGVVTALCAHLIRSGHVDAAAVTIMPQDGSLRPSATLVSDPSELASAQKSKYCPVALDALLKEIAQRKYGISHAQEIVPSLEGLIIRIGLFCDRTLSFLAAESLVDRSRMPRDAVQDIIYKDKTYGGWPGDVNIRGQDGQSIRLSNIERLRRKDVFTPVRCRLCFDRLNVLADLAIGDPWGISEEPDGASVILARSNRGLELFRDAVSAGAIRASELTVEQIIEGQGINERHRAWAIYIQAWRQTGYVPPEVSLLPVKDQQLSHNTMRRYARRLRWGLFLETVRSRDRALKRSHRRLTWNRLRSILGSVYRRMICLPGFWLC